jgi:hypothetical protein
MKNYAVAAWNWINEKASGLVAFAEPIAKSLKVAIEAGDVEKIKAHNQELREFHEGGIVFCDTVDEFVADGNVDLYEGATALKMINDQLDQAEDVITGVDEDDA